MRRLDDRFVPDRGRGKYDAPRPMWLMLGGLVGSIAGIGFVVGIENASGVLRVVIPLVAALIVSGYLALAVRWRREHLIKPPSG